MEKSPDAFRTISEVATWLDTPAHVLRFWESRFPQVKPVKRAGGRRYYRPTDMALLGGIKKLLHEDGLTIRGVQKILKSEGVRHVAALSPALDDIGGAYDEDEALVDASPEAAEPQSADQAEPELAPDAPEAKPVPPAPDLSGIPEGPLDDDPNYDVPPGPFPLFDPQTTRRRLAASPAKSAALYARLVALGERMPQRHD